MKKKERNVQNYTGGSFPFLNFRKTKLLLIVCCCLLFVQTGKAQLNPIDLNTYAWENNLSGVWLFEKAEYVSYQYGNENGVPIEEKTFDRLADVDIPGFLSDAVFRKMEICGGTIICTLNNFGSNPFLLNNNQLDLIKQVEPVEERELLSFIPLQPYSYAINDETIVFIFDVGFGDSRYDFSLTAKLTIILRKQLQN